MNKTTAFSILALSLCAALLLAACGRKPAPVETPAPIPPVNNFQMQNLLSEFPGTITTADYAEQVQLIIFLRTDGAGIAQAIADWNTLQHDFAGDGFTVLGAVVDDRPNDQLAPEAIALNAAFPIGQADAPIVTAFGGAAAIRAIPTAFLLTRDGALARTYPGYVPLAALRDDVVRVLDGQPLPSKTAKAP